MQTTAPSLQPFTFATLPNVLDLVVQTARATLDGFKAHRIEGIESASDFEALTAELKHIFRPALLDLAKALEERIAAHCPAAGDHLNGIVVSLENDLSDAIGALQRAAADAVDNAREAA